MKEEEKEKAGRGEYIVRSGELLLDLGDLERIAHNGEQALGGMLNRLEDGRRIERRVVDLGGQLPSEQLSPTQDRHEGSAELCRSK